ncbi:aminomethyl transferase family protein [Subtercola sp. YIM 133946]|uniref:aminomethyl transferase family protein n=1 Tax=Subtercola sp. YIM 133946 TaxID=3118909 RepID=UPI002F95C25A
MQSNTVHADSMEDKLREVGNPALLYRNRPFTRTPFPFPAEYTGWPDEQRAWRDGVTLFDQSHIMTDVFFEGPDVKRLFSDFGVNSMATFGAGRAKQYVACNPDGMVIGDAVLFALADDRYDLVGNADGHIAKWLMFQIEAGDYDVAITLDPASPRLSDRTYFRYQLNGPLTRKVIEAAAKGSIDSIGFFRIGEMTIAGRRVHALNHTMAGVPGDELTGLELFGPAEDGPEVLAALIAAGKPFDLRLGGSRAYPSSAAESGWIARPVPAIYSGEAMRPYREWLSAADQQANPSMQGSFTSDDIADYYATPWALGYGRFIAYDHDFVGRDALERLQERPKRQKVWLVWNQEDVMRVMRDSLFAEERSRPRIIDLPMSYRNYHYDAVLDQAGASVGLSMYVVYTVNLGDFVSLTMLDESLAVDGTEVTVVWGQGDGGASNPFTLPHVQTTVRATVSTRPLV